jgi:hypothetical protein
MTRAMLLCQHCKDNFLQLGAPLTHYIGDDYDKDNPLNTRGNWIEIPCECENCDKITSVVIAFHKGQIFIETVPTKDKNIYTHISRVELSDVLKMINCKIGIPREERHN